MPIGLNLYAVNKMVTFRKGVGEHAFACCRSIGLGNHMEESNHETFQGRHKTRIWPGGTAEIRRVSNGILRPDTP